jgi:hypothetical protein
LFFGKQEERDGIEILASKKGMEGLTEWPKW